MKNKKSGTVKKYFMPYLRLHKDVVALDLFCAALTTLCELVLPVIARKITAVAVSSAAGLTMKFILQMALLYAALKGVDMIAGYYMIYVGHSMGVKIEKSMREDLFAHLLKVPLKFYDKAKIGQLMSRITTDMFDVSEFAHHCPEEFFIFALKLIVSFVILSSINLPLTLVSFATLPLMLVGTMYFRKKMHEAFKQRRVVAGEVNAKTETALLGIRVIKSFTCEEHESEQFKKESTNLSLVQQASYRFMARLNSVVRFFDGMMYIIMILMGGVFILQKKITPADYTAYLLYDAMLIAAVKRIVEFIEQFEKGLTGIERFAQIMELDGENENPGGFIPQKSGGTLEFKNVTFSYGEKSDDVLENVSFTAKRGQSVAIVGPSGGGKTTLCSLISRFYDISSGQILLDGKDLKDYELCALRSAVGTVEQEVYIFSGTIRDNIRYAKPNATQEEIERAARLSGADEFIKKLENGYDSFIGERGTMLSGGQRQRLSIARVFLKDPPILVLDEATSALDNESERIVKDSLAALSKSRTTITVAHRLSTVKSADKILVLNEKGIAEQGTHEELLEKNGIYAKLYHES